MTGKKKLIERKVDRLVFNVENSVASQGLDLVEALAKTPMVRTTDEAISIAGKSNVAVMVNDKLLNLSGQELINYLKTLRSDDIARIEVITTPPARYEAEGKSGLINIILKKNTNLGWNASLQTSGNYYFGRPTVSSRSGLGFNYQGRNFQYLRIFLPVTITGREMLILIIRVMEIITTGILMRKPLLITVIKAVM